MSRDKLPPGADFLLFCRRVGPGVVGLQVRALTALPPPGADRPWRYHTLLEALSPVSERLQRDISVLPLRPRSVSVPAYRPRQQGAARSVCSREGQARVRGSLRQPAGRSAGDREAA